MTGPVTVSGSPHAFDAGGGVGNTCASIIQATIEPSSGGNVKTGGSIVYVYTQSADEPSQPVYVHVYVLSPAHAGSGLITGPVGVIGLPHESSTDGGVGITCASAMQSTVDPSSAGSVIVGVNIVYVYTHGIFVPSQSVKVQVYVLSPSHAGSGPTTGPVGVTGSPHELITVGGVGTVCASATHGTVEPSSAGKVKVGGSTV
jgi:hypothetical protein